MDERKGFYMLADGCEWYTDRQICDMLRLADALGFPLEKGSYVEKMTIAQLARLTNGFYDA